eukprot:8997-Rhodomonas_salina.1
MAAVLTFFPSFPELRAGEAAADARHLRLPPPPQLRLPVQDHDEPPSSLVRTLFNIARAQWQRWIDTNARRSSGSCRAGGGARRCCTRTGTYLALARASSPPPTKTSASGCLGFFFSLLCGLRTLGPGSKGQRAGLKVEGRGSTVYVLRSTGHGLRMGV